MDNPKQNAAPLLALLSTWEARAAKALPADAMLVNKHVRELREALASEHGGGGEGDLHDQPVLPCAQIARNVAEKIYAQREEVLGAFVAKYGFQPDEAVQVFSPDGTWRIERLTSPAPSAAVGVAEVVRLRQALGKLMSYNMDIRDGKINYRAQDHIDVAAAALQHPAAPSVEEQPNPLARYWMNRSEFWMQKAISLGWREVRDAANGEAPSAPPSVAGDAGELPDLLDSIADDTRGHSLNGEQHDGLRNAANLIRRLATAEQPGSAVQGENLTWALEQGGILADWCNVAGDALRSLLDAYERRVRSSCTTDADLASEPWRCAEYVQAEQALNTKPSPSVEIITPPPAPAAEQGDTIIIDGRIYTLDTVRTALLGLARDVAEQDATQPEACGVEDDAEEEFCAIVLDNLWKRGETQLYEAAHEFMIDRRRRLRAAAPEPVRVDAYAAGWRNAAKWASRDDLISDIGSPAYERDKAAALSANEVSRGQ